MNPVVTQKIQKKTKNVVYHVPQIKKRSEMVFFPLTTEMQVILLKVLTAYRKVEILEYIASCKS